MLVFSALCFNIKPMECKCGQTNFTDPKPTNESLRYIYKGADCS